MSPSHRTVGADLCPSSLSSCSCKSPRRLSNCTPDPSSVGRLCRRGKITRRTYSNTRAAGWGDSLEAAPEWRLCRRRVGYHGRSRDGAWPPQACIQDRHSSMLASITCGCLRCETATTWAAREGGMRRGAMVANARCHGDHAVPTTPPPRRQAPAHPLFAQCVPILRPVRLRHEFLSIIGGG